MTRRKAILDEAGLRRLLADDEDGQLEFKKGMIGRKEIGEYAVGIGNAGGGWLVFGVTDRKPRRITGIEIPPQAELQRIRDSVLDLAGITIDMGVVGTKDGSVLALRIPSRPRGQIFSTKTGKFLMRSGEGLRGMPLAEIERLRREEVGSPDYTAEPVAASWQDVVDPVELARLKRVLADSGRSELAHMEDEPLLRGLELVARRGARLVVTRAAVLLVGTPEAMREHVPAHEVKVLRFERDDLVPDFHEDSRAPLLAVVQRIAEAIEISNAVESFQAGLFRVDVPKFPQLAYREAIVNALTHRDYQQAGNVAVRIYARRIEVASPGGWFGSVNEKNVLVTESQRRNELLASVMQRVGLAERSALGVKRMFRAMLEVGKVAPEYRSTATSVTVTLHDGSFDREFAALARRTAEEGAALSVFDLLILSHLRRHREITTREAAALCQRPESDARALLDDLRNRRLIDRLGEGRARKYVLGSVAYEGLSLTGERPRDLQISERTFEGLLIDELRRVGSEGLTPRQIREWSRYGKAKTTRLLQALCERGLLSSSGKRGRGARYWLSELAPAELEGRHKA